MEEKILYGEQTRKTRENMSFSGKQLSGYPEYIRAMAQVKWACARANERAGQLSQEKTERIGRACQEIIDGGHLEQFPVDVFHGGGGIGLNMNMNEVLAALAGGEVQPVEWFFNFCQLLPQMYARHRVFGLRQVRSTAQIQPKRKLQRIDQNVFEKDRGLSRGIDPNRPHLLAGWHESQAVGSARMRRHQRWREKKRRC